MVERDGLQAIEDATGTVFNSQDFTERLGLTGEFVRSRSTTVLPPEGTTGLLERVTEWGDYDIPGDGHTLTLREGGPAGTVSNLTYNRVTNDGATLDSQTVFFGTEYSRRTHAETAEDGSFSSQTVFREGEEILSRSTLDRQVLSETDITEALAPTLSEVLLGSQPEGAFFQDVATFEDFSAGTQLETTTYSSETGGVSIALGGDTEGALIQDSLSGVTVLRTPEGDFLSTDGGQTLLPGAPEDVQTAIGFLTEYPSGTRTLLSAANRLNKVLQIADEFFPDRSVPNAAIPSVVGETLDRYGSLFAGIGIADAVLHGDPIEALRSAAAGTTSFAGVAEQQGIGGRKPPNAPRHFTTLGQNVIYRAGSALSLGLAGYDLIQGDYKSAILNGVTGAGLYMIAAPEPLTTAAGLVLVSGAAIYQVGDILLDESQYIQHAPFEF